MTHSNLEIFYQMIKCKKVKKHNQMVWDSLQNPSELLKLFDSFNDKKAGKRIVQYIKNR